MAVTFDAAAFERGTDPILDILTVEQARALVTYSGDEELRARIDELAAKNTEGLMTDQERAEYQGYVRANNFMSVLQAKARKLLRNVQTDE
jgi:selenocysteine lyase/cysteine desulfurase